MKILLIEDEKHLAESMTHHLKKEGFFVDTTYDGESGLKYGLFGSYDLILLDWMLPKLNGIEVLKRLRADDITVPILLLTAKGEIEDKVLGLDAGADDYLAKPFATAELLARVRALLRRRTVLSSPIDQQFGDLKLNMSLLELHCKEKSIKLTLKEAELLEFLMVRKCMITSKELFIEKLWGIDSDAEHNNVEVYISFLRKKFIFLNSSVTIKTTRGVGYLLEVI